MSSSATQDTFKNWALICHARQDRGSVDWLSKRLPAYSVPRFYVGRPSADGSVPKRVSPIARLGDDDGDELPLTADQEREIKNSRYLLVICSPFSARSRWVDDAVKYFKSLGREHRVICLIVDGEPYASSRLDPVGEECLPRAVKYEVNADKEITETPTAPFAADIRPGKDSRHNAIIKLAAGMLRLDFGELKQRDHDENLMRLIVVLGCSLFLVIFFCGLASYSFHRVGEAEAALQNARAEMSQMHAEISKLKQQVEENAQP